MLGVAESSESSHGGRESKRLGSPGLTVWGEIIGNAASDKNVIILNFMLC